MYLSVVWYLFVGIFFLKYLWNWDFSFYFLKYRRVKIFILNIVLIIKNIFVEFIVFKKVKVNVVINGNENVILYVMVVIVEIYFVNILDDINLIFVVVVLLEVVWWLLFKESEFEL